MKNNNTDEHDVESVFKFTRPTEYNTFFGRYLVTRIYISHGSGVLGILDIDSHPTVYHRMEVKINETDEGYIPHINTFSWSRDQSNQVVKLNHTHPPQLDDEQLACLARGFSDRIAMIMKKEIPYSLCAAGLANNGNYVVSPEINAIGSRTLLWLEEAEVETEIVNCLYFPMFKLDKQRGVFYYSRDINKQPFVEFSSVDEFKKSEYYIQGDDVALIALAQQEECLLEVERQLMGIIN